MNNNFSNFIENLISKNLNDLDTTTSNIKTIYSLNHNKFSNIQKIKILENIFLVSKNLEDINSNLKNLLSNIINLNNFDIPSEISNQIQDELDFQDNINQLLPLFSYLFLVNSFSNQTN